MRRCAGLAKARARGIATQCPTEGRRAEDHEIQAEAIVAVVCASLCWGTTWPFPDGLPCHAQRCSFKDFRPVRSSKPARGRAMQCVPAGMYVCSAARRVTIATLAERQREAQTANGGAGPGGLAWSGGQPCSCFGQLVIGGAGGRRYMEGSETHSRTYTAWLRAHDA